MRSTRCAGCAPNSCIVQARGHRHSSRIFLEYNGIKNTNRSIMGRPLCLSVVEHKSLAWQGVLGWGQGYDELSGNGQFATQRSHAYVKRFLKYRECKKRRHCSGSCHATSEDRVDVAAPQTGESRVRYGSACSQGPRETMEDVVHIIENGPCGFFFASTLMPVCDGTCGMLEQVVV